MSDRVDISPEAVDTAGTAMNLPSTTITQAMAAFKNTLAALGKPWGDDEIGQQWASAYEPGVTSFVTAMDNISEGLTTLSKDLKKMGVVYETEYNSIP